MSEMPRGTNTGMARLPACCASASHMRASAVPYTWWGPPQRVSGAVDMPLRLNEVITTCGLSSDDSAYTSGSELLIDGGAMAQ
jgi:hypothetical protein